MLTRFLSSRLTKSVLFLLLSLLMLYMSAIIIASHKQRAVTATAQIEAIFASDSACVAPCWRGIIPGLSSRDDFLTLLQNPAYKLKLLRENQINLGTTEYIWDDSATGMSGQVRVTLETVTLITFQLRPDTEVTLGTILEALGPPDSFLAELIGSHDIILVMELYYANRNMVLKVWADQDLSRMDLLDCEVDVANELPIRWVYFLEDEPPHLWMHRLGIPPTSGPPMPWQGLGTTPLTTARCRN